MKTSKPVKKSATKPATVNKEILKKNVAKQYAEKLISYEKEIQEYKKQIQKLNIENKQLKDDIQSYKEWLEKIKKISEFSDDERLEALKKFKIEIKNKETMNNLMNTYGACFNKLI